jgi:hypothetical protein
VSRVSREVYLYSQVDYEALDDKLLSTDWNSLFHLKSLQHCWEMFKEIYNSMIDTFIPHKYIKPGSHNDPP